MFNSLWHIHCCVAADKIDGMKIWSLAWNFVDEKSAKLTQVSYIESVMAYSSIKVVMLSSTVNTIDYNHNQFVLQLKY